MGIEQDTLAAARADQPWQVEQRGIDAVPETDRHGQPRSLFWPWCAANLSFFPVAQGVFVVALGLDWWQALIAVLVGLALTYPLVGVVATSGPRSGAPTLTLSRAAFGVRGNTIPTAIAYVAAVGWEIISVALGALATRTVLQRLSPEIPSTTALLVGFVLTAASTVVIGVYGFALLMRAQKWITLASAVMTVGYFVLVLPKLDFSFGAGPATHAPLIAGITLSMAGGGLGWAFAAADYSRYLPKASSPRAVAGWTTLGAACAPVTLMIIGVLISTADPALAGAVAKDPIGALATQVPTWFLVPFLLGVLLSVIGGAVIDLYSSGLILQALGIPLRRPVAAGIDGVLMVLGGIYVVFVSPTFFGPFQAFLIVLGVATAAWLAVFAVDLLIHRRAGYVVDALYTPAGVYGRYNAAGLIALVVAVVAGLGLVTSPDPNVGAVLGYWLTDEAKAGSLGASNIGLVVAFVLAGVLYAVLSTTVLRERPSRHGN